MDNAIQSYCRRFGTEPRDCRGVLISSLTKAAAAEFKKRDLVIHPDQIGTLHAHAFRALGRPTLCVEGRPVKEWNGAFPVYRFGAVEQVDDFADRGKTLGDRLLAQYHTHRSRLVARTLWSVNLSLFAEQYETWKRVSHYLDFSDVIHEAWECVETAPGNPEIIFVDEAQDHDRAELRLVRKWAEQCEKLIIVGDPDQNLYEWRGSDPKAFYEADVPPERHRVLERSYRVPRAVHTAAVAVIERCHEREPVTYYPRDEDGQVKHFDMPLTDPRSAACVLDDAEQYLKAGKEVMFLASCDYMLRPLCAEIKQRGIPFWNPYAPERGQFNPLHPAQGVSSAQRLMAFLRPAAKLFPEFRLWTVGEFKLWSEVCYVSGLLRRGDASKWLEKTNDEHVMEGDDLRYVCENDKIVCELLEPSPRWLLSRVKASRIKSMEYAVEVFETQGLDGLCQAPRALVGTIHSVKGGEADVVYLAPDLSPEAWEQFDDGKRDSIYRLMYVGMTRAKETLILCAPKTSMSIDW